MKSVVVIGNGPAQVSGQDIDRHTVVRMCHHEWQTVDRYGERYDYGLITRTSEISADARRPGKWLFYNVPGEPTTPSIDGTPVVMLDARGWYRKAKEHGAIPGDPHRGLKFTKGFAAVAGVIERLRPRRVIVIGMNILRDGVTGLKYYDPAALPFYKKMYPNMVVGIPKWAADELPAGLRGEGPHDYFTEAAVIREIASEAGIELVWEM